MWKLRFRDVWKQLFRNVWKPKVTQWVNGVWVQAQVGPSPKTHITPCALCATQRGKKKEIGKTPQKSIHRNDSNDKFFQLMASPWQLFFCMNVSSADCSQATLWEPPPFKLNTDYFSWSLVSIMSFAFCNQPLRFPNLKAVIGTPLNCLSPSLSGIFISSLSLLIQQVCFWVLPFETHSTLPKPLKG